MTTKVNYCLGGQAGFTLIELIMVITIIGILAVIAVPRFLNLRKEARDAASWANIGAMRSAAAMYYARTATDQYECLCYAVSNASSCNNYGRSTTISPPCYPANTDELEALLNAVPVWPNNGTGACYNETTGGVVACF